LWWEPNLLNNSLICSEQIVSLNIPEHSISTASLHGVNSNRKTSSNCCWERLNNVGSWSSYCVLECTFSSSIPNWCWVIWHWHWSSGTGSWDLTCSGCGSCCCCSGRSCNSLAKTWWWTCSLTITLAVISASVTSLSFVVNVIRRVAVSCCCCSCWTCNINNNEGRKWSCRLWLINKDTIVESLKTGIKGERISNF